MNNIIRLLFLTLLTSCSAPNINLSTPEPIKLDIAMRLDVYQHSKESQKSTTLPAASVDPAAARRNRMADIQTFKDSRLVGEGCDSLLSIRVETPGDYGDYIRKAVSAENEDRMALMKSEADKQKIPLTQIQKKQAEISRKMAFKGEWIEIQNSGGSTLWVQKEE